MPRRKREVDPSQTYSPEEIKRLKRNERQRRWYAKLPEERKNELRAIKRENRKRCDQKKRLGSVVEGTLIPARDVGGSAINEHGATCEVVNTECEVVNTDRIVELGTDKCDKGCIDCSGSTSSGELIRLKRKRESSRKYRLRRSVRQRCGSDLQEDLQPTDDLGVESCSQTCDLKLMTVTEGSTTILNSGSLSLVQHWRQQIRRMECCRKPVEQDFLWNKICPECRVALLPNESEVFCCNRGKRILPKLPVLPRDLADLYNESGFSSYSRKINHLFCFTALGVAGGEFMHLDAPSSIAVMGRIYHKLNPTSKPCQPLRWYIHDSDERNKVASGKNIPLTWVMRVAANLDTINPYCGLVKRMKSMNIQSAFLTLNGSIAREEVAAILHANNTVTVNPRLAVFWLHQDEREVYMSILDPQYEPLQYPLLFPHGTKGWYPENEQGLSQIDWYRSRLLHEPIFLQLGRLTCEYLVDMYSRVEEERLNFLATNGYEKPTSSSDGDFAEENGSERHFLPSSFIGCRQWCSVQIADALALARVKGRPSLFITMTTNPDWPEIKAMLRTGQSAADIPVVVVRAFHARFQRLKDFLRSYLGPLEYMIHVIEFQKRGLPHGHIVLKTTREIPLHMIDSLISAEIPTDDEQLAQKVRKYMLHQHSDRCSRNGSCCWKYPRPVNQITHVDAKGYVQYRRRKIEDTHVVSYSPFLLNQFDCHINVDIAGTVHIFMYLYTYIYKGFDRVQYRVDNQRPCRNEVHEYQSARYLSSTEAAWRILNFHVTEKHPTVICLPLHHEEWRCKSFRKPNGASLLERYFLRPVAEEFSRLTYVDYYEQYTLLPASRGKHTPNEHLEQSKAGLARNVVRKRTKRDAICRIRLVMPREGELFYLRQLLLHAAVRNWQELKVYNGQTYETYEQVVNAMGLLHDKSEAVITMEEAISCLQTPSQLRFLFTLLILDGGPAVDLWTRFHLHLIQDFHDSSHSNMLIADQQALMCIEKVLCQHGSTVTDFGLPPIFIRSEVVLEELLKYPDHNVYLQQSGCMRNAMKRDQARIYDCVKNMLKYRGIKRPLFIDGRAGTGKTFLLNAICLLIRGSQRIVIPCATTGLAALLYPGGKTAHSVFHIPVMENNVAVHSLLSPLSEKAKLLKEAEAIIWDEFAMANKAVIESVNVLLQRICDNDHAFGGKCFIAAGDFRQIAPIVQGSGKQATLDASIKSSYTWKAFTVHRLDEPIRNAMDLELVNCVNCIGENWQSNIVTLNLFRTTTSIEEAQEFLYPPEVLAKPSLCERRAFLSPLNVYVDEFNTSILNCMPTPGKTYFSYDSITENDQRIQTSPLAENDFLNSYEHSTLPRHKLELKEGSICQIMRLLDADKGLVKNARVVIHELHNRYVTVRLLGQTPGNPDHIHAISRADFFHQPRNSAFTIRRRQLPLRLAYSTTFHSCLGLTLDKVVLDLRTDVFAHGQLYTALTRIRRREDVLILHDNASSSITTKNVVFKELLE